MNSRVNAGYINILLIFIGVLPLLSTLAYVVPPSITVMFQWIGLIIPMLIVFNIGAVIVWFFNRKLTALIPVLNSISIVYFVPLTFQWNSNKLVDLADLRVASYNVREMRSEYGFSTLSNIADFAHRNNLDLLFLQEVPKDYSKEDFLDAFVGMQSVVFNNSDNVNGKRLAILSKYNLSDTSVLSVDGHTHYALFASLDLGNDKIKLANCHLQTTNWNQLKRSKQSLLSVSYSRMSENFKRREQQVLEIRKYMDQQQYPLVVGGDFNEPPVSYSYHTIGSNLKDAFREAGRGYNYTYRYLSKLFRIDYIFFNSNKFEAYNYRSEKLEFSDHLPVLVDLVLKK